MTRLSSMPAKPLGTRLLPITEAFIQACPTQKHAFCSARDTWRSPQSAVRGFTPTALCGYETRAKPLTPASQRRTGFVLKHQQRLEVLRSAFVDRVESSSVKPGGSSSQMVSSGSRLNGGVLKPCARDGFHQPGHERLRRPLARVPKGTQSG